MGYKGRVRNGPVFLFYIASGYVESDFVRQYCRLWQEGYTFGGMIFELTLIKKYKVNPESLR
jgi:hypothetical protein